MKKVLFLLSLIFLCGCEDSSTTVGINKEGVIPFASITHFEYNNHQYIKFDEFQGSSSVGGVVHDPDCKYCNKK